MAVSIRIFAPVLLTLLPALAGCDSATPSTPSPAPSSAPPAAPTLAVFRELKTGFATSDLRDAQDQIVQVNSANELIWAADGQRLPGYRVIPVSDRPALLHRRSRSVRKGVPSRCASARRTANEVRT